MEFQLTRLDVVEKTERVIHYQFADGNALSFIWIPIIQTVRYIDYLLAGNRIKLKVLWSL